MGLAQFDPRSVEALAASDECDAVLVASAPAQADDRRCSGTIGAASIDPGSKRASSISQNRSTGNPP